VREYWTRQFTLIDGHVDPVEIAEQPDGSVVVDVHQVVHSPAGELLQDTHVTHTYAFGDDGLVTRMDIG
jgi:hypothetical protein